MIFMTSPSYEYPDISARHTIGIHGLCHSFFIRPSSCQLLPAGFDATGHTRARAMRVPGFSRKGTVREMRGVGFEPTYTFVTGS